MTHKKRFFTDQMVHKTEKRTRTDKIYYKLSDKLTFGKHLTRTIENVILEDPEYIQWAFDSIPDFFLDEEATKVWRNRMLAIEGEEE